MSIDRTTGEGVLRGVMSITMLDTCFTRTGPNTWKLEHEIVTDEVSSEYILDWLKNVTLLQQIAPKPNTFPIEYSYIKYPLRTEGKYNALCKLMSDHLRKKVSYGDLRQKFWSIVEDETGEEDE